MDEKQKFLLEEFKALRGEVELYLAEIRGLERNTIIAVGAIWAWLIHEHVTNVLAWGIPIVLTISAGARIAAIDHHLKMMATHIRLTEDTFKVAGWEHRKRRGFMGTSDILIGVFLIAVAILALLARESLMPRSCTGVHLV